MDSPSLYSHPATGDSIRNADRLSALRPLLCVAAAILAALALLGWAIGSHLLQSIGPGMISMKINTAAGLILLSIALYGIDRSRGWRWIVWTCLSLAAAIAVATIVEYVSGYDFRIDDIVVHDADSSRFPGRMAPATAVVLFCVAGAGAMLQRRRGIGIAQIALLLISAAPLTTLGGYLYRAPGMYSAAPYPVIALHTSVSLMLLCIAGLFVFPERALMNVVTAHTLAGAMARRLLPAAIGVPILAGLFVLAGERWGWYSPAFGSALLVAACGTFFAAVVWRTMVRLADAEFASGRAKHDLAEAQRRSDAALLAGEVGTFDWDVASDRVYGDANFARLFQLARDEGGAYSVADYLSVIHPEDRDAVSDKISRSIADNVPFETEYRIVSADGVERWVVARGRLERDEAGKASRFPGVIVDITDRKRAEADRELLLKSLDAERVAIAASERQRRLALDAAEMGAWNIDATTLAMTTDARFRAIFGIATESCDFEQAFAAIHPDDRDAVRTAIDAAMRPIDPAALSAEYRIIHPDGSIRWAFVKGRATTVDGPDGPRVRSLDGTVADITDRKAAGADLAFQQKQLELIFRESPAAMALWRGSELVFERVNPQYQDLFRGRELLGKPLLEACPELRGQGFDDLLRKVMLTGEPFVGHEVLARLVREKDGPIEDLYFDFKYLQVNDGNGRPWGVYNHAVNVTGRVLARKAMERGEVELKNALSDREALLEAERTARIAVEHAGRMKDEFLATLSHELRTPLNAILGWSQVLRGGDNDPETLSEGLSTIERNARAQTQIIEDLLDMSRIISGKVALIPQRIDLTDVIQAAVATVRATAAAKQIEIEYTVASDARFPIVGDLNRLQQVFWNLLSNSIKFTPRRGSVRILVEQRHSMWQVDVIDNGEGISKEFLPFVFDRFRQADASTTREHAGLGLGLAIVKQLVELHGGMVRVRSDGLGKGATFTVSLPVRVIHDEAEPEPAVERNTESVRSSRLIGPVETSRDDSASNLAVCDDVRGRKVLVVDDEHDARTMLKHLFEQCEAVVFVASNADETLELLQRERPDVLVSDIGMPVVDGYELIRRVRQLPAEQGGTTPAIALTAYARAEDRMKAVRAGFQMHVPKPVEPAELMAMIASVLR